jgi:hypothetical protein
VVGYVGDGFNLYHLWLGLKGEMAYDKTTIMDRHTHALHGGVITRNESERQSGHYS